MKSSCRHLPLPLLFACLVAQMFFNGGHYPGRGAYSEKDPPYVLGGDPKPASNLAVVRAELLQPPELLHARAKMGIQIEPSLLKEQYSKRNNLVKKIIPSGIKAGVRSDLASAVLRARKALGFSQASFAEALGTLQGQIAKWESDKLKPSGQMCAAIARIAPEEDREWWLNQAGFAKSVTSVAEHAVTAVPLLRDSLAAGTPRAVDEREIEAVLTLPSSWFARSGKVFAVRVSGDSMAPIIGDGSTVLIDVSQKEPSKLVERMVAARDGDGVTVKWLRKDGDVFLLVPQYTSLANPVRVLRLDEGWGIVGLVVKWIGEPPAPPRKR